MSDRRIRNFIFIDTVSNLVVYTKRAIGLDLSLNMPGLRTIEVQTDKPLKMPSEIDHWYDPIRGFIIAAPPQGLEFERLSLLRKKIEILTLLNTNIQLLIGVLEDRFTPAHAAAIPVSRENRPLLEKFLEHERDLLIERCHRQLADLVESIFSLNTPEAVRAFYKDFSDHTIIGDYSASNRGML